MQPYYCVDENYHKQKIEVTKALCTALEQYLIFDTKYTLDHAKSTQEAQALDIDSMTKEIMQQSEVVQRLETQIQDMKAIIEKEPDSPMAIYLKISMLPMFETSLQQAQFYMSRMQEQLEIAQANIQKGE